MTLKKKEELMLKGRDAAKHYGCNNVSVELCEIMAAFHIIVFICL